MFPAAVLPFHSWLSPGSVVSPLVAAVVAYDLGVANGTAGPLAGELAVAARASGA